MSETLVIPCENATQMRDHWWWRPGWRPGRRFYGVFATFEDQPALHRLMDEWQERLATLPDLDMVPTPWRHLTIQGIGFTDEVTDDQLDMITTSVEQSTQQRAHASGQVRPARDPPRSAGPAGDPTGAVPARARRDPLRDCVRSRS